MLSFGEKSQWDSRQRQTVQRPIGDLRLHAARLALSRQNGGRRILPQAVGKAIGLFQVTGRNYMRVLNLSILPYADPVGS